MPGKIFRKNSGAIDSMKVPPIEQQVAALRPTLGFAADMHKWLLFGAGLGVIAAVVFWHPVPLMLSAFLAIVGFSEQRAGPNIVAAIYAYDFGMPTLGEATISITCWDLDNRYHAIVREPDHSAWEYEFIPQGWQTVAQTYLAKIWRDVRSGQPVLAAIEQGIMIPRYDPKPAL
jgi:hypothetical protein